LKQKNKDLKEELEKALIENKKIAELEDELDMKDKQIELLELELDEVRKEKQEISEKQSDAPKKLRYEPV